MGDFSRAGPLPILRALRKPLNTGVLFMLKFVALVAGLLFASTTFAQQSLQTLHARVPAPPTTAAASKAWLASAEITALRKQLKDQRTFIERLSTEAGAAAQPAGAQTGGVI